MKAKLFPATAAVTTFAFLLSAPLAAQWLTISLSEAVPRRAFAKHCGETGGTLESKE